MAEGRSAQFRAGLGSAAGNFAVVPEMVIGPLPTPWESFRRVLGVLLVILAVGVLLGIATRRVGIVIGAVATPLLATGGFFGQLATVKRDETRKRRALAANVAPGTLYVANAIPIAVSGEFSPKWIRRQQRSPGVLVVNAQSVSYTPTTKSEVPPYGFSWSNVARVELTPVNPITGRFSVTSVDGYVACWRVDSAPDLIQALERLAKLLAGPPRP